jgi:excinuclease ABC subunit C
MTSQDYKNIASSLPDNPGVYRFIDSTGKLIYVGKAKNLKKRISSYFVKTHASHKTAMMIRHAGNVEYTVVDSEKEALLLENSLIKEYQPHYNISLKDDKTYPFICIKNEHFPRVFITRKFINDGSEYFGPYTSVFRVREILDLIKSLYPLRNCSLNLTAENISKKKFKVCLEYHLGNCKGPCEAKQTEDDYNISIENIRSILKGNVSDLIVMLKKNMAVLASDFKFEDAEQIKQQFLALEEYRTKSTVVNKSISHVDVFSIISDEKKAYVNFIKIVNGAIIQIKSIEITKKLDEEPQEILELAVLQVRQELKSVSKEIIVPFKINFPDTTVKITVPKKGDRKRLLELSQKNVMFYKQAKLEISDKTKREKPNERVLKQLKEDFKLKELPVQIECFDNSNFQGSYPVASMVVFKDGKPSKKDYRHFNIKTVTGPDDFASMEEIVYRRYKRVLEENTPLPQLIIIDGGKGQLSAALSSLNKLNLIGKVAIAGIAKRLEEIYFPGDPLPLYINKKSESLRLIQHIRDEAHRFAITFHRKKRQKGTLQTELTKITGIGKNTAEILLKEFKSVSKIKSASEKELADVVGNSKAKLIIANLK